MSKIEMQIGNLYVNCEGDQEWVENQIEKLLDQQKEFIRVDNQPKPDSYQPTMKLEGENTVHTYSRRGRPAKNPILDIPATNELAIFLKAHDAVTNQVKRFLATAVFLVSKGNQMLTTSMITNALSRNKLPKLSNASDCLNKNTIRGFCKKEDKEFVVTELGFKEILD